MTKTTLTDGELLNIVKSALAAMARGDAAAAERIVRTVPRSQLPYVANSLRGAIADKRAVS